MERRCGRVGAVAVAFALLLFLPPAADADPAGPLRAQWHLDDYVNCGDACNRSPDSSGNGLDGTPEGFPGPTGVPGRFGDGLSFTGANDAIRVADNALLRPTTMSLVAWVKSSGEPGRIRVIAGKGADGTCGHSTYALYTGAAPNPAPHGLQFYVFNGAAKLSPDAGPGIWDNQWHMVAGTYDGATVRLYVDGHEVGSGTPTQGNILYGGNADDSFGIGNYVRPGECGGAPLNFPGSVDEVRVYSRALDPAEVTQLASAQGPNPPELIPGGGGGGGGGGGRGGGVLPPLIDPHYSVAPAVKMKRAVWLNAKVSNIPAGLDVRSYEWDLNNDGKYDAGCGGNAPALSGTFNKVGPQVVGLKVTDVFDRTTTVKQTVSVTQAEVNKGKVAAYDCEAPIGAFLPTPKDCVKTFAFGIVEVQARGAANQCFELKGRSPFLLGKQAKASGGDRQVRQVFVYHAKIAGPVAINGLPIPVPARRITEYDEQDQTVGIGTIGFDMPLPGGKTVRIPDLPLNATITGSGKPPRYKLPPLKAGKLAKFGALSLGGGVEISLLKRAADVTISLKLPDFFKFGFNREAEGQVTLRATNTNGFSFEGVRIAHIPKVFMGPLVVDDLFFDYHRTGDVWSGGANFQLAGISPVQIKAAPPPPDYGFGMRGGRFDHAGGGIAFPNPPRPEIFPGVSLQEIGGSIGIDPYRFTGRITIAAAEVAAIDGSAFIALASQDDPYDFPEEFAPPGLDFLAGRHLDSPSIAVGGQTKLQVPILGELPLLNSYLFYAFPDYVEFGGGFKFEDSVADQKFSVEGNIGGFASVGKRLFNLEGKVGVCVDIDVIGNQCLSANALVSSTGIAFCTIVPIPLSPFGPVVPVKAGLGYRWGGGVDVMVFSCDAGPYRVARPASARAAQSGAQSVTLPAGLPSAMIKVVGGSAAPSVVLTGPKGERILAPQTDPAVVNQNVVVLRLAQAKTTLIALKGPAAGRWTVTPQPGSTVTSVAARNGLSDPSVKARVTGRGRKRVLVYSVRRDPGQTVTFLERGLRTFRPLGNAVKSRGRIAFAPAAGSAGKRRIVALVKRDGVTRETLDVATYSAPAQARPAKPRRLRLRRRSNSLVVTWARARGAFQYAVTVTLGNGRRLLRVTRKRRITIAGIDPRTRATVRVGGLRADSVHGAEAVKALRARRR